ncbi:MAG: RNA polymerase-associated protein RapA [Halieaceae bacterium]|jgi:ATP-dependent helicase HepA|nr:RNA polymerase-associated protein RapA [Halieaceae bacterium]
MSDYKLGQRWVSHADAELGLGIIVEVDAHRVTVHFPAVAEDRTYAADRAPLTRLHLNPGDTLTRHDGHRFEVTAVEENDGVLTYTGKDDQGAEHVVSELELDARIQLNHPKDRLLNNQLDKLVDFRLRYATLAHRAHTETGGVRGLLGARTSLLSHQMYIASEVGRRFAPRVLLADEVGLGKTIEAGLILNQQLLTGRATRILVVVPDALIHQWLVEMLRRFNLRFSLFDESRLCDGDSETGFDDEQLIISPFSLFANSGDARALALAADWDLVVVDEAHHLSWSNADESHLYDFVTHLSRLSRGLLLLTATPEQAGVESHFARLQLLDPDRYSDFEQFCQEQADYGRWNDAIEALSDGRDDIELPPGIDPTLEPEDKIRQLLDRFGTGRVLFRNTRASVPGFPARRLHHYPLPLPGRYEPLAQELYPERQVDEAVWLAEDPRVAWLESKLRELRPEKVLVICAHRETALALEQHLHLRAGIRCAAFHEGLTLVERDRAAAYFADDISGAQALICSEIGSEGRNFQFAHHLICFDLPKNPDLLEQRIGRLDRIGQIADVDIHVPTLENSAQQVIFQWLNEGLAAFTHPCSVGHTLLDMFVEPLDLALSSPNTDHSTLMTKTREQREALEVAMQAGRDRLLELNSHDPEQGAAVINQVQAAEAPDTVSAFAELLFDRIGVSQDLQSETCFLLKPTEMMLAGQLPGLEEDGVTVTFDRDTALARDDVQFLTWEHPLLLEAMDIVATSELGNATLGTFKHPKIQPGTVLLEALFTVDCLAPTHLEMGRYLDMNPIRVVMLPDGRDVGDNIGHEALNRALQPVPTTQSAAVIQRLRPILEKQISAAEKLATDQLAVRQTEAGGRLAELLGEERERLIYLSSVNPAVRSEEIEELDQRIEATQRANAAAQVSLNALRVAIAT